MSTPQKEEAYIKESFEKAQEQCTVPYILNYETNLPGSQLNVHNVLMIIGGGAGIISTLIAIYLMAGHLMNWSKPREQKQCIRIILFSIVLSLVTFFSVWFYDDSGYIAPIGQLYEGFAVIALYLLFVQLVVSQSHAPGSEGPSLANTQYAILHSDGGKKDLKWLGRSWIMVFQIAVTRVVTTIASEILFGATCPLSTKRQHGLTVITVIESASIGIAVFGIIQFERRTHRGFLKAHGPVLKMIAFKAVVLLQAVQGIVFSVLAENQVLFPTSPYRISYNDYTRGFPGVLFLLELTVATVLFLKAFAFKQYRAEIRNGAPTAASPLAALFEALNPVDIVTGLTSAFTAPNAGAARSRLENNYLKVEQTRMDGRSSSEDTGLMNMAREA